MLQINIIALWAIFPFFNIHHILIKQMISNKSSSAQVNSSTRSFVV